MEFKITIKEVKFYHKHAYFKKYLYKHSLITIITLINIIFYYVFNLNL